jgi:putative tricarboxylic transport membrane protein
MGSVLAELGLAPAGLRTTNMPGAGGGVAYAHAVARRGSDRRLLVAASPATTLRLAQGQYGPLSEGDVRWVASVGAEYGIVAVSPDAPWTDLAALMAAWARAPDSIVASGGSAVLGQDHVKVLLLARVAGLDPRRVRYVPFDGGGEALTALVGGFVQVFSGEASEVEGQLRAGRLRVLAVLAPERLDPPLDGVPTAAEQGFPVEWVTWRGFYVPGEVPDSVYTRWVDVLTRAGASDAWERARARNRLRPFLRTGAEFEAFVTRQVEDFRALSRELGMLR